MTAEADPGIKILGARLLMTASRQYRDYFELKHQLQRIYLSSTLDVGGNVALGLQACNFKVVLFLSKWLCSSYYLANIERRDRVLFSAL